MNLEAVKSLTASGRVLQFLVGAMLVLSAAAIGYYLFHSLPAEDDQMFLQVILMGALGSHVTVGMAFAKHQGDFNPQIVWWYPIRLVEGAFVAVAFWLALKAGMLGIELPPDSPWSALAYSAIGGMFSHKIIEALGSKLSTDIQQDNQE
jgi:hypothetical protein